MTSHQCKLEFCNEDLLQDKVNFSFLTIKPTPPVVYI